MLKPFEDFKINLNRIESRPSNKGEYAFEMALDFNGDIGSPNVQVFFWHGYVGDDLLTLVPHTAL